MIFTLNLPLADHNLTINDLPNDLAKAYWMKDHQTKIGDVFDELKPFIPYAPIFEKISDTWQGMQDTLAFILDPDCLLTYKIFRNLKSFISMEYTFPKLTRTSINVLHLKDIDELLFNVLNLKNLRKEPIVVPDELAEVIAHPLVYRKAVKDKFKYPIKSYYKLVVNYDKVLDESCYQYSIPRQGDIFWRNNDELIIMETLHLLLENEQTPKQYFIEKGRAYLFVAADYKQIYDPYEPTNTDRFGRPYSYRPSPTNYVYRDLTKGEDGIFVVQIHNNTYSYRKHDPINERFSSPIMEQLEKLMRIYWWHKTPAFRLYQE